MEATTSSLQSPSQAQQGTHQNAKLAGTYVIGHNGIHAQKGKGIYDTHDPINLSPAGNHLFMANVPIKLEKILLPFHTAYQVSKMHKPMTTTAQQHKDITLAVHNLSLQ